MELVIFDTFIPVDPLYFSGNYYILKPASSNVTVKARFPSGTIRSLQRNVFGTLQLLREEEVFFQVRLKATLNFGGFIFLGAHVSIISFQTLSVNNGYVWFNTA